MTIEEKSRIKMHLDDLVVWLDEQPTEETAEEIAMERDYWRDECEQAKDEFAEVVEQRDKAFAKLDEMEAKLVLLADYLKTVENYHRQASVYYVETGDTQQEALQDEAFGEVVSVEVMYMKLFDENNVEYVKRRISMYDGLAQSYERRFKI